MIRPGLHSSIKMLGFAKVDIYVTLVVTITLIALALAWDPAASLPGGWELSAFVFVALILHQQRNDRRVAATGSTTFVIHMAAGLVFGGFWGGVVACVSTAIGESLQGKHLPKVIFNSSQRALSLVGASLVYSAVLGGGVPPAFLQAGQLTPGAVQRDLVVFLAFAATYVLINATAVSGVISLSTGRAFREVWHLNFRGLLVYDLWASFIAVFVAWIFVRSHAIGYGSLGLIATFVPLIVVRHVYTLYHQLEESGQELLQVMVKAIEARDPYTSGHSLRVHELSRTIARELGLSARKIEEIETAALLHDVGKIHEEFAPLLRKEGRLTQEETALMQTHAAKSAELVAIISKFRGPIQQSVRHHHERWDGLGYPDGLARDTISLGARIILIADTVDAMTTDRPYRKRLPLEAVITELQRCKGTQFDPALVDVAVSSVAVRRLIVGPVSGPEHARDDPLRSKRVSWPAAALWKARRA